MQRHLFLTGDIQVGKSTIISRVLAELDVPVSGFLTVAVPDAEGSSNIFLVDAQDPVCSEKCRLAHRVPGKMPEVREEVFVAIGIPLLQDAAGPLILMDELGWMESSSYAFQQAVFAVLDEDVPVLGVVRDKRLAFLNAVRDHHAVEVLVVTRENREEMVDVVRERVLRAMRDTRGT
ncbi:nucleoside-triphosphatase [Methanorbis rubei]|uniref:Nucleotide kinase n=1 Tax=Methanorbis rubei TaxID=3028300 RepID=A0AAE4MG81_9EURY|nr:hypothetical protein [Methanocorpusculaceae archaeon Cs1]